MECPPQVQVLKCKRQKSMHIEDGLGIIVFFFLKSINDTDLCALKVRV